MKRNPFAINFGKIPTQYISRDIILDEIIGYITDTTVQNSCFMLTGARGSGKTVMMTSIEKEALKYEDFIVIRLNPARDMLSGLVAKLYDTGSFLTKFIDTNLNLSKFGIGIGVSSKPPVADIESALETILKEMQRKKKKLLVTIDEVSNTKYMREFASSFQIMIRSDYPVYLVMAGLYENIHELKDQKDLTFLYRTPQFEMEPLNLQMVADRYAQVFDIPMEDAMKMAIETKGYPFAYQALGKYVWEEETHKMTNEVLIRYDEALSHYVYKKIWSELSEKDKWFMSFIVKKECMPVSELLELTKQKKNEFSQYRIRLRDKGLIDVQTRGVIKYKLPRFDVFIKNEQL
jgi:hypothetical protein